MATSWAKIAATKPKPEKKEDHQPKIKVYRWGPLTSLTPNMILWMKDGSIVMKEIEGKRYLQEIMIPECPITKKPFRSTLGLIPEKNYILNYCTLQLNQHSRYHLPTTFGIRLEFPHPDGLIREIQTNIWIVPKLVPKRDPRSSCLAAYFCSKRLHHDAMYYLLPYLGAKKITMKSGFQRNPYLDEITGPESFHADNTAIDPEPYLDGSKLYSLEGILHLVKTGVMEIAIYDASYNSLSALTEHSFRHIFPNGIKSYVFEKFKTVENMLRIRANIIKKMEAIVRKGEFIKF